jgi:hypothetical protein
MTVTFFWGSMCSIVPIVVQNICLVYFRKEELGEFRVKANSYQNF